MECKKAGNPSSTRAKFFGKRSLGRELDFQLALKHQLLEELVLADIAGDHLLDLTFREHQTDAETIHPCIIGNTGEILHAFFDQGGDAVFGDAAKTETAERKNGSVEDIPYRLVRVFYNLVHFFLNP